MASKTKTGYNFHKEITTTSQQAVILLATKYMLIVMFIQKREMYGYSSYLDLDPCSLSICFRSSLILCRVFALRKSGPHCFND